MAEAVTVDPSPERAATSSSTALNLDGILLLEAPSPKCRSTSFDASRRRNNASSSVNSNMPHDVFRRHQAGRFARG